MDDVVVVNYDPEWPQAFEALRSTIWDAVSDIAVSVEHVGSTAVPGLSAKPVIDIDVVVDEGVVAAGVSRLSSLGYEHRGDLGIPGREAFRSPPDTPRHHLYLCIAGSPALANHLAVRDYLRANPVAASDYSDLKRRLASEHPKDIDSYVEAKSDFLVGILHEVGFAPEALAEIRRMNRKPQ
ncbi:MAG: GrpB family protein [Longimicrobiales bacterium]